MKSIFIATLNYWVAGEWMGWDSASLMGEDWVKVLWKEKPTKEQKELFKCSS